MKVRAKAPFLDLRENVDRKPGEVFECSEERFEEINATRFGTLAERVSEQPEEADEQPEQADEDGKPARKPARRKKAAQAPDAADGEE